MNAWLYDWDWDSRKSSAAVFFIKFREGRVWGVVFRMGGRRDR